MQLSNLHRGDSALIIDVPHAGTHLPEALRARMTAAALAVPDTDWHVEKLYDFARGRERTLVGATHSRYVVDLNRDPSGAALYPARTTPNSARPERSQTSRSMSTGRRRRVEIDADAGHISRRIMRCSQRKSNACVSGTVS